MSTNGLTPAEIEARSRVLGADPRRGWDGVRGRYARPGPVLGRIFRVDGQGVARVRRLHQRRTNGRGAAPLAYVARVATDMPAAPKVPTPDARLRQGRWRASPAETDAWIDAIARALIASRRHQDQRAGSIESRPTSS